MTTRDSLWVTALQVAEKVGRFVGRALRHDIKSVISSGVLTPKGADAHFSAACLAADQSDYKLPQTL